MPYGPGTYGHKVGRPAKMSMKMGRARPLSRDTGMKMIGSPRRDPNKVVRMKPHYTKSK